MAQIFSHRLNDHLSVRRSQLNTVCSDPKLVSPLGSFLWYGSKNTMFFPMLAYCWGRTSCSFREDKRSEREADLRLHLVPRLRVSGAVPFLPYTPSSLPQNEYHSSTWVGLQVEFSICLCAVERATLNNKETIQCGCCLSAEENIRKLYNAQFFNWNLISRFEVCKTMAAKNISLLVCDDV